ncbi:MAG TPA: hypothetical protein DIT97_28135, partial [Gimesia maris]|nr:hypothetical protein [Gimesia maris]
TERRASGLTVPQAHHIFPVRHFTTKIGEWLCCCGIDLDSSQNGVWLPSCDYPGRIASIHTGRDNSKIYTAYVLAQLRGAKSCADAKNILVGIKQELLNGTLALNRANPTDHPC